MCSNLQFINLKPAFWDLVKEKPYIKNLSFFPLKTTFSSQPLWGCLGLDFVFCEKQSSLCF